MYSRRWSVPALGLALVMLLALGAACGDDESPGSSTAAAATNTNGSQAVGTIEPAIGVTNPGSVSGVPVAEPTFAEPAVASAGFAPISSPGFSGPSVSTLSAGASQPAGIWVSGAGRVAAQPDQAVVSIGVEARASTVAQARADSARAMADVVAAIKARGVADQDIQTQHFSISPQYTYVQRTDSSGGRYSEQVLVGYIVSNRASVVVRDLEQVGQVVDDAAEAGGDLVRIQGISFTIEDPTALHRQAREAAVQDAMAKAQQFAAVAGVTLGRPVYIAETGATPIVRADQARAELSVAAAAPPTPISGGELTVQVTVQVVFAIQ